MTADSMSIGRQPQPVMVTVTGGESEDVEYWFRELDSSKRPFSLCIRNYTICAETRRCAVSLIGLGYVKTRSDLVVMLCGARSFAFIRALVHPHAAAPLRPSRRRIKCSRRRQLPVIRQRTAD